MASNSSAYLQEPPRHSVQWNARPKSWHQRRNTVGEGMHSMDAVAVAVNKRASVGSQSKPQAPERPAAWGRYSGGLGYDYEGRGVGVGGSAGTRQLNSCASVKSLHYKHQYGVDLSDVPIMLQRV